MEGASEREREWEKETKRESGGTDGEHKAKDAEWTREREREREIMSRNGRRTVRCELLE